MRISLASAVAPSAGLDLSTADASFANLVSVMSVGDPLINRVEPGDADNSYLILKLEANGVAVMPPTGMLNQSLIDDVRSWIDNGAVR